MPRPITMDPEVIRGSSATHKPPRQSMLGAMEGLYRPSWEAGPPVGWGMTPEDQHESRMRQAERYQPLSTPLSPTAEYDSNTAGILLPLLAGQVGTKALEKVLRGKAAMGGKPPPGGGTPGSTGGSSTDDLVNTLRAPPRVGPTGTQIEGMPQPPGVAPPASWPKSGVLTPEEVYAARGEMARRKMQGLDPYDPMKPDHDFIRDIVGDAQLYQADKAAGTPVVHLRGNNGMDVKTWKTPGLDGDGMPSGANDIGFQYRASQNNLAPVSRPPMDASGLTSAREKAFEASLWSSANAPLGSQSAHRLNAPWMPQPAPRRPARPATTQLDFGGISQSPSPPASTPTSAMRAEIEKRGLPKTELVDDLAPLPPVNQEQAKMLGFKYNGPDAAELARRYDDEWWANFEKNRVMQTKPTMGPEEPLPPLAPMDPETMRQMIMMRSNVPQLLSGPSTVPPPRRR